MNDYQWLSQDITFCLADNCPIREYCHRYVGRKVRIASFSNFEEACNHSNIFAYFMQANQKDTEEYRRKDNKLIEKC